MTDMPVTSEGTQIASEKNDQADALRPSELGWPTTGQDDVSRETPTNLGWPS